MGIGRRRERHQQSEHSRRVLLRAGVLLALGGVTAPLSGCGLFGGDDDQQATPDPLEPLRDEALDLAARYRAAIGTDPSLAGQLEPIAQAHEAHAAELSRVIGRPAPSAAPSPATSPSTGDESATLTALRQAEQAGRKTAAEACAAAPAERAALVGSIAAARATHAEALQ